MNAKTRFKALAAVTVMAMLSPQAKLAAQDSSALLDSITFGEAASETNHDFSGTASRGGLGEPARILLPLAEPSWAGGRLAFSLKVDPQKQNYATARLWGSDATQ